MGLEALDGDVFGDAAELCRSIGGTISMQAAGAVFIDVPHVSMASLGLGLGEGEAIPFDDGWLANLDSFKGKGRVESVGIEGGVVVLKSKKRSLRKNMLAQEPPRPKLPDIPFTLRLRVDTKEFEASVKAADVVGDFIYMHASGDQLHIGANSPQEEDHDPSHPVFRESLDCTIETGSDLAKPSIFSTDLLMRFLKVCKSKEVILEFAEDCPMLIHGAGPRGTPMKFMQSPRVRSTDA